MKKKQPQTKQNTNKQRKQNKTQKLYPSGVTYFTFDLTSDRIFKFHAISVKSQGFLEFSLKNVI